MRSTRVFLATLALALIGLAAATPAAADGPLPGEPRDSILWTNPAGGDWSNPANWTPANVPDTPWECAVLKPLAGDYLVTIDFSTILGGCRVDSGGPSLEVRGATLRIDGVPWNRGTIRVTEGGTFRAFYGYFPNRGGRLVGGEGGGTISTLTYWETGGTIENTLDGNDNTRNGKFVADGGDLTVNCGTIVNGEVVRVGSEGAVRFIMSNPQNLVVTPGAEVVVVTLMDLTANGSALHNHGTVRVPGEIQIGGFSGNYVTLGGTGEIILEDGILDAPAGADMIHAAGHTIRGCGVITGSFINHGTVDINCPAGAFEIDGPAQNLSTMRVSNGLLWLKGAATQITNYGTLSAGWGSIWIDEGATIVNPGVLDAEAGWIDLGRNTTGTIEGGVIEASAGGHLAGGAHSTLRDVTLAHGAVVESGANMTVTGVRLVTEGWVHITSQGSLTVGPSTDFIQTGGGTVLQGGTLNATRELQIQGGSLRGVGLVNAGVANHGELAPDAGPGALRIQGNYRQFPGASLTMAMAGPSAISRLEVTGNAVLDGTMETTTIGTYCPTPGSTYDLMTYGSGTGQFDECLFTSPYDDILDLVPVYGASGLGVLINGVTGVEPAGRVPTVLRFYGRGLGAGAGFVLDLPRDADLTIRAYDTSGREVALLANGARPAGAHAFSLGDAARGLASGVYFARAQVRSGGAVETLKARVVLTR